MSYLCNYVSCVRWGKRWGPGGIGKAESHIKMHNMMTYKDKHVLPGSPHHLSAFFFVFNWEQFGSTAKAWFGEHVREDDLRRWPEALLRIPARKYFARELSLSLG